MSIPETKSVSINEEFNEDHPFEIPQLEKIREVSGQDLFKLPVQSGGENLETSIPGPEVPGLSVSEPSTDLDSTTSLAGSEIQINPEIAAKSSLEEPHLGFESEMGQSGGSDFNPEGFDLSDLEEVQIEESGNPSNPGEDVDPTDHPQYDLQQNENNDQPQWIHPDLSIEDDYDIVSRMNQDEIELRVTGYLENYYSDEYLKYQKYFQSCHSSSNQKFSLRKDKKGNLYLNTRPPQPKEKRGKKVKENVQEIMEDITYDKHYLIKLTPPKYIKVSDALKDINLELNVLSGEIKLLQQELIDQGADIHDEDVKHFKKLRRKFYKLVNKKYIFTKYYQEVNNLNVTEVQTPVYAKEIITDTNKDDMKIYKFQTHMVNASETLISNMVGQIKDDLENYTHVVNHGGEDQEEYHGLIKDFLKEKKTNQEKIQKELSTLISLQKGQIDYLIEKLPKVDIKKDPFNN